MAVLGALAAVLVGHVCHAQTSSQATPIAPITPISPSTQAPIGKDHANDPRVKRTVDIARLMEQLAGNAWETLSYPQMFAACTMTEAPAELLKAPLDRMVLAHVTLRHMLSLKFQKEQDVDAWFRECTSRVLRNAGPGARVYTKSAWDQFARVRPYGIGLNIRRASGEWVVVSPIQRGPAAAAGIESGDILVSVDGFAAQTLSREELVEVLRDDGPTPAVLEWRSTKNAGALRKLEVKRDVVVRDERVAVLDMGDHLYVGLPHFYESTPAHTFNALRKLKGSLHLPKVIDLRGNGGGLLASAQWTLAAFGKHDASPPWFPVRYRKTEIQSPFDARAVLTSPKALPPGWTLPTEADQKTWAQSPKMFVLIDRETASGAVWLAAALRELNGAVLVGSISRPDPPGMEVLYSIRSSDKLYALRYEAGKLALPSGKILLEGTLVPDMLVEAPPNAWGLEYATAESWKADPLFQQVKTGLMK